MGNATPVENSRKPLTDGDWIPKLANLELMCSDAVL